jgi:hypothetical protein
MTVRQPFHEFLDSGAGPSTPRGQGRGRGGRGYNNDARGVFLGRPRGRGGSQSTDYSNVPFDYDKIGKQSYVPLSGTSIALARSAADVDRLQRHAVWSEERYSFA